MFEPGGKALAKTKKKLRNDSESQDVMDFHTS